MTIELDYDTIIEAKMAYDENIAAFRRFVRKDGGVLHVIPQDPD